MVPNDGVLGYVARKDLFALRKVGWDWFHNKGIGLAPEVDFVVGSPLRRDNLRQRRDDKGYETFEIEFGVDSLQEREENLKVPLRQLFHPSSQKIRQKAYCHWP